MVTKETKPQSKTNNSSKGVVSKPSKSREEILKDTLSFDEFKKIFAKKMDERLGTNLCK